MNCSCDNNPLILPVGATGPQGPQGIQGIQGIPGPTYFEHYIGEEFEGGIIFALWKDNTNTEHGLIVDTNNLSDMESWSNIISTGIGNPAKSLWDGLSNSTAITTQVGHTFSAAQLCFNSTNNSKTDWYLPSIDELALLYNNRFYINQTLSSIPGTSLIDNDNYWSSTEYDAYNANYYSFVYGNPNFNSKDTTLFVRAIRKF